MSDATLAGATLPGVPLLRVPLLRVPLLAVLLSAIGLPSVARAEPVRGYADVHIHIAAHLAVPVYGDGPDAEPPAGQTYDHALKPTLFASQLADSDVTLYVSLAYANPFSTVFQSRASMKAHIERQLDFVEAFAARHADRFAWARTPAEARAAIAEGKAVIVHGIEGATKILNSTEDARYWASRGVAVVTPVHLADNTLGGSFCMSGSLALLNIPGCWREALAPAHHTLTKAGAEWVGALSDAGVVIDLAHASPSTFDALVDLVAGRGKAPVYTHVVAQAVRDERDAMSDDQLRRIYGLGGLVGITANYRSIAPEPRLQAPPDGYCPRSIDDLRLHWDHVTGLLPGQPVAWGSDFQGGVTHLRPKYGPLGCADGRPDGSPLSPFDVLGLAHAGMVGPLFEELAATGSDRAPLDASAERFLQIWELARGERTGVTPAR